MQSGPEKCSANWLLGLGLFLARFCPAAWIGAATLFVIVGVTEVTRGGFDSTTKDQLIALRFPAFYWCGSCLIAAGGFGLVLIGTQAGLPGPRWISALVLLFAVLALMTADYQMIYQPLLRFVTPPGQAKPASFAAYHEASKIINLVELLMCFVVSVLVTWPVSPSDKPLPRRETRKPDDD